MSAQERIAKLTSLLERVRARGTRDDAEAAPGAKSSPAAEPVAVAAAPPAEVVTPLPVPTPVPASVPVEAAPTSGVPEVTVGRELARDPRENGRRISNVPASVRGSTDQELPSVIIAPSPPSSPPPPAVSPISVAPISTADSSVELEADDVIEAAPAPSRSHSRPPPPPPPGRSPTVPPPPTAVTPVPVPEPAAPPASLSVPTPATAATAVAPVAAPRQPEITQPRQSENRLGDADITAGHPVIRMDVELDDEVPTPEEPEREEAPAPSSSRRPRSEHAAALDEDEPTSPPHTVPPESGRQSSLAPAESGKRTSVAVMEPERVAPPASVRPDVVTGRQPETQVASFVGQPAVTRPATFGELLDNALSL